MADLPHLTISDPGPLERAYSTLLGARDAMITAFTASSGEPFQYYSALVVDAAITGLMAHFQELARNPSAHKEIDKNGVAFFIQIATDQIISDFRNLTPVPPSAAQGTDGARERAVRQP
jgi:hypothetical protein